MKNNKTRFLIIDITIFVVFSLIVFLVPFVKNWVFGLSYLFTIIAILAQVVIVQKAFIGAESVKSRFYGFPIIRIGVIYLIIQVVCSVVFMAFALVVPLWIPIIVYTLDLGFVIIGTVSAEAMRDEIERQDAVLITKVKTIRSLQSQVNSLPNLCCNEELKKKTIIFADNLRYSDPVSSEATETIEMELSSLVSDLQNALMEKDEISVITLLNKLENSLIERNRICKLNKV